MRNLPLVTQCCFPLEVETWAVARFTRLVLVYAVVDPIAEVVEHAPEADEGVDHEHHRDGSDNFVEGPGEPEHEDLGEETDDGGGEVREVDGRRLVDGGFAGARVVVVVAQVLVDGGEGG